MMDAGGNFANGVDKAQYMGPLLIAEDDDEDFFLTQEALKQCGFAGRLLRVCDGEELMEYILRRGVYADPKLSPIPRLVIVDLNMPKRDGRQALRDMKSHPLLRAIPVLIMTTSAAREDIRLAYDLGVNAFVTKPLEFAKFVVVMHAITAFWFVAVEAPGVEAR